MQLLRIDWNVVWTIINLLVLFVALRHFLYNPVMKVMDERKIVGADNILIQPMKEYKLNIFATLIVQDNYSQAETLSAVGSYLSDYFATGNFDISQDVSITDLESSIYTNINGVRSFRITSPNELTVEIPDGYVAVLENKTISVTGGV